MCCKKGFVILYPFVIMGMLFSASLSHGKEQIESRAVAEIEKNRQVNADNNIALGLDANEYGIQPGDILQISVWREEELQREVLVSPDGYISFPLVNDFLVLNKSPRKVKKELKEKLSIYIPDASVNVALKQVVGNRFYVIGQVNRPGDFVMTQNVDVLQALSMAGGASRFAKLNDILVLRRHAGRQEAIKFKYGQVAKGKKLKQNILLQSGDVVLVP